MLKKTVAVLISMFLSLHSAGPVLAQDNTQTDYSQPSRQEQFKAIIVNVLEEKTEESFGTEQVTQKLEVRATQGEKEGELLIIENVGLNTASTPHYKKGDKVIISGIESPDGSMQYFVLDYVRTDAMMILFILFIIVTLAVARWRGLASLLGMAYSFFIIFAFVLPQIFAGQNPIIIALIGGALIVPVTFYMSHGFNKKTHAAIIGTLISLAITGILAYVSIEGAKLSGFATEDAAFLELASKGSVNIKGLVLAGIIVGLLGILDDITVSQAAIVYKLRENSPHLKFGKLYSEAMDVGKDHIGSLVNTLVLVYTGAALPFLLLFTTSDIALPFALNYELVAEEIVRTLVASIGLILAVPITTFIAATKSSR